jgi:hypothetical protein
MEKFKEVRNKMASPKQDISFNIYIKENYKPSR